MNSKSLEAKGKKHLFIVFFGYFIYFSDYIYLTMDPDTLHNLMTYWERSWYASMILFLLTCVAFITGIITFEFKKVRIFFLLFAFSNIITGTETRIIFFKHLSENEKTLFWVYGMVFSSIIEFIAYYYFFFKILKGQLIKSLMKIFSFSLGLLVILFLNFAFRDNNSSNNFIRYCNYLISIDVFFIIIPPLFYYWEILKMPVIPNLFKSNAFLISTCIFFPYILILPFLNLSQFLKEKYSPLYVLFFSAHYILYCFLFVALIRAFVWKKPLTI